MKHLFSVITVCMAGLLLSGCARVQEYTYAATEQPSGTSVLIELNNMLSENSSVNSESQVPSVSTVSTVSSGETVSTADTLSHTLIPYYYEEKRLSEKDGEVLFDGNVFSSDEIPEDYLASFPFWTGKSNNRALIPVLQEGSFPVDDFEGTVRENCIRYETSVTEANEHAGTLVGASVWCDFTGFTYLDFFSGLIEGDVTSSEPYKDRHGRTGLTVKTTVNDLKKEYIILYPDADDPYFQIYTNNACIYLENREKADQNR